jgi:hypothetical protein
MEMNRRRFLTAGGTILASTLLAGALFSGSAAAGNSHLRYRWDIIQIDFAAGTVNPGGQASAIAEDGSMITLTGHGTFVAGEEVGNHEVSGGGTWQTFDPSGNLTGHGTYRVTSFVRFTVAPGAFAAGLTDRIGNPKKARSGLLFVTIRYSNGAGGVLTVSCRQPGPPPGPASMFEGIRVSMGYVDYWNGTDPPPPPNNGNRTLFHIIGRE